MAQEKLEGLHGVFLLYDVTSPETLEHIEVCFFYLFIIIVYYYIIYITIRISSIRIRISIVLMMALSRDNP